MKKVGFGKRIFSMINAAVRGTRPKKYTCRFMAPGLTSYPGAEGKDEIWYLPREVMNAMQPTFIGCPVVAERQHNGESVPDDFEERIKKGDYDGVITDVWTDKDGWDWCSFIVWDPSTQESIEKNGYNVSCAFNTIDSLPGGILNSINYDHEVAQAEYIHMAIVSAPRQTGAKIFLNSIDNQIDNQEGDVILFNSTWNGRDAVLKLFPNGRPKLNKMTDAQMQTAKEMLAMFVEDKGDFHAFIDQLVMQGIPREDATSFAEAYGEKLNTKKNMVSDRMIDKYKALVKAGTPQDEAIAKVAAEHGQSEDELREVIGLEPKKNAGDEAADFDELKKKMTPRDAVKALIDKYGLTAKVMDVIKMETIKTNAEIPGLDEFPELARSGKNQLGEIAKEAKSDLETGNIDKETYQRKMKVINALLESKNNSGGDDMEKCNKCGKLMSECNCSKANEIDPEKAVVATPDGDVPFKDMINAYQAAQAAIKKNAEDEEAKKKAEEEAAKKNAEEDEAKKKAEEEAASKKNAFQAKVKALNGRAQELFDKYATEKKLTGEGGAEETEALTPNKIMPWLKSQGLSEDEAKKTMDEWSDMLSGFNGAKKVNLDDEFEGVKVSSMYDAWKTKKNADDEAAKKKEEADALAKKNADRVEALKAEGKSDDDIKAILASEAEDSKDKDKDHFNLLNSARDKVMDMDFSTSGPQRSKTERIAAVKQSKEY